MASIGPVSCLYVRRVIPASKLRTRTWVVPGISGYGSKVLGYGDSEWTIEAEYWSNNAGVDVWLLQVQALQGSIVTIIDDHSDTYLNCLIKEISQPQKSPAIVGGVVGVMGKLTLQGVRK